MRRIILKHFAYSFCQMFLNSPNNHDLAALAKLGSGTVTMDVLTGRCLHNGADITPMRIYEKLLQWLERQAMDHRIEREFICMARLEVVYTVTIQSTPDKPFPIGMFNFDCRGEVHTDEVAYTAKLVEQKSWGLMLLDNGS